MMMSSGSTALQTSDSGSGGNKRTPCSFYGCKRVYSDMTALESHIKEHDIPAQSLPGKVLLCSTVGCSGSFPNMQKLMAHMRHHHKPNIFFLCESCRTKLRSYRGLLTHLHTCSKVPRGKTKTPPLPAATNPNQDQKPPLLDQKPPLLDQKPPLLDQKPPLLDQKPLLLDSVSSPQQLTYQTPNPEASFPAADLKPDPAAHLLLSPPFLSNLETSPPPQLTEADLQPQIKIEASDVPILSGPAAAPESPDAQSQHLTQIRSLEPVHSGPESAPRSPPGASIVWKKGQGQVYSRRILWEHTRGRYTCVQCGHTVTNRKEMTQHISTKHSGNKPAEDTGSSAYNT